MDLDYFKLIDRIVDLNIDEKKITVEAQVPTAHTIFEGHFPGYPIMPGVLLTEAMAQSSGWLLLGVMKFERMPFLAMVKEAKMRGFVSPGDLLTIEVDAPTFWGWHRHRWRLDGDRLVTSYDDSELPEDADFFAMLDRQPWVRVP